VYSLLIRAAPVSLYGAMPVTGVMAWRRQKAAVQRRDEDLHASVLTVEIERG